MPGLIGKKIGMTSVFTDEGKNVPCTVIEAGPCTVTQIRTKDNDGYEAVQLAFGDKKEKQTTKALSGHFKAAKSSPKRKIVEFRDYNIESVKLGDEIGVGIFEDAKWVDVGGISKGKGFQGVVKRHGFAGVNDQTHGQHDRNRAPGSLGGSSYPSRVFKGIRMAGQTGDKKNKVMNLQIMKVIPEHNLILVKGAVPGYKGSYLIIEK